MRAFILRRLELISRGYGSLILLGSRHSAQTLRLREFLTRNGHPYTYIDLDTDIASQELLDRFNVKLDEIPVIISGQGSVLRNPTIQKLAIASGSTPTFTPRNSATSSLSAPVPLDSPPPFTPPPKVSTSFLSRPNRPADRPPPAPKSKTTSVFPTAFPARNWPIERLPKPKNSAPR